MRSQIEFIKKTYGYNNAISKIKILMNKDIIKGRQFDEAWELVCKL